jgi:hypothetical protein
MINFCLQSSDRALSGPSRSKVLNELTNDVFKAVMIGYDPWTDEVLSRFPQQQQAAISMEDGINSADLENTLSYVRCLEELTRNGITQVSQHYTDYGQGDITNLPLLSSRLIYCQDQMTQDTAACSHFCATRAVCTSSTPPTPPAYPLVDPALRTRTSAYLWSTERAPA